MQKLLNLLVLVSFHFGYIEWGGQQSVFIFQAEADIFHKAQADPASFLHPFILIPLAGMLLLIITLFQKYPRKAFTITGIICLSVLLLFIAFIGIISRNFKILASALPFIVFSFFALRTCLRRKV